MPKSKNQLQDFSINPRIRLAACWTSVMFCYVYGDFFTLFTPGRIQHLMNGESGVGTTTPYSLLVFALLMTVPALMILLSLIVRPVFCRWLNIITGLFFSTLMLLIAVTSLDEWMLFYTWLALVEIVLTSFIVWMAFKWPQSVTEQQL
jgi:Family of unknown function (DUF6326)